MNPDLPKLDLDPPKTLSQAQSIVDRALACLRSHGNAHPVNPSSIPLSLLPTVRRYKLIVTRNTRCPCGSGKRFKRCCMDKDSKREAGKLVQSLCEKVIKETP